MDPLTPEQREEYEDDLISFSDNELDLLGDIHGLKVLYAGGTSLLWLEGLAERVGKTGTLTALDMDEEKVRSSRYLVDEAELDVPVRLVAGDVFAPPFEPGVFDLVYSAGLFHELDVRERTAHHALAALASLVRPGGRVATSDFVDTHQAIQLEDEAMQAEITRETSGARYFGIGAPGRLVRLHEAVLENVRWRVLSPYPIRHLDKLFLAEEGPVGMDLLLAGTRRRLRERRERLRHLVERGGYTRPATVFVEGTVG